MPTIKQMIRAEIASAIAAAMGIDETENVVDLDEGETGDEVSARETANTVRRRRRPRRVGPQVMYRLIEPRGPRHGAALREVTQSLVGNPRRVLDFMRRGYNPTTAKAIEAGTGLNRKATESAVWLLRNEEVVQSEDYDAESIRVPAAVAQVRPKADRRKTRKTRKRR